MAYQIKVEQTPDYLHIAGAGTYTEENLRRFLLDAHRATLEHPCSSILLELDFAGRSLNMGSLYSIVCEKSAEAATFERIALVDVNPERTPEHAEFVETVAINQGVNIRLFATVAEAMRWLQDSRRQTSVSL